MASPSSTTGWSTGVSVAAGVGAGSLDASGRRVGAGVGGRLGGCFGGCGGRGRLDRGLAARASDAGVGGGLRLQGVAQLATRETTLRAGRGERRRRRSIDHGRGDGTATVTRPPGGEIDLVVRVRLDLFPVDAGAETGVVLLGRGLLRGGDPGGAEGRRGRRVGGRIRGRGRDRGRRQQQERRADSWRGGDGRTSRQPL